jgi:hypothetical protein
VRSNAVPPIVARRCDVGLLIYDTPAQEPFAASFRWIDGRREGDFEEVSMARIIVRCQYTGHYIFTGVDTERSPDIIGGSVMCPYCVAEHVWLAIETRRNDARKRKRPKPIVRHAS